MNFSDHPHGQSPSLRRRAGGVALACLLLRALIPLGFMPGNVLAGEFMVLCPAGLPASVRDVSHHGHGGHHDGYRDADRDCPIGDTLQQPALPLPVPDSPVALVPPDLAAAVRPASRTAGFLHVYRSRAPPAP